MLVNIPYVALVKKFEEMKQTSASRLTPRISQIHVACVNERQIKLMHELFYSFGVSNYAGWERAHLSTVEEKIEYIKKNKFIEFTYNTHQILRYDGGGGRNDITYSQYKKEMVYFPLLSEQEEFE